MRRHRHDRAGAVLHQHVVRHVHRDLLAVDGVGDGAAQRHARLRLVGGATLLVGLGERVVDVLAHRLLVLGALGEAQHVGVLGRHHKEGRAEQRVGAGREHGVVDRGPAHPGGAGGTQILAAEHHFRALRAPDPVALHRLHVLRPLDPVEVPQQPLGVVGDAQEPLLQLADFDLRAAALAAAVHDLLVGEHRLVVGAPLHRRLLAVGEAGVQQLQEDPLRPAVVARFATWPARATSRSRSPIRGTGAGRRRSRRRSSRAG